MYLSPRVRGYAALAVTALALTQVVGAAVGSAALLHIGMAIGFAPLPRPFGGVGGYESFAARHTVTFVYADGAEEEVDLHAFVSHLTGPHRAKISVLQGFIYMPTFSLEFTAPLANRLLCSELPRIVGRAPVRAELTIQTDTAGWEQYAYRRSIACARV